MKKWAFEKILFFVAAILSFHLQNLNAEIEQVMIKWTPGLCQDSCIRGLEQQFRRIQGVTQVNFSPTNSQAILQWAPNVPFSYRPIEGAMAHIGLSTEDIFVTVRGKISHTSQDVILTSIGDNTPFHLLSTPQQMPNQFIEENSPFNRALNPEMRSKLLEVESNQQIVTISGPLFHPETSPPLFLVVVSLKL